MESWYVAFADFLLQSVLILPAAAAAYGLSRWVDRMTKTRMSNLVRGLFVLGVSLVFLVSVALLVIAIFCRRDGCDL